MKTSDNYSLMDSMVKLNESQYGDDDSRVADEMGAEGKEESLHNLAISALKFVMEKEPGLPDEVVVRRAYDMFDEETQTNALEDVITAELLKIQKIRNESHETKPEKSFDTFLGEMLVQDITEEKGWQVGDKFDMGNDRYKVLDVQPGKLIAKNVANDKVKEIPLTTRDEEDYEEEYEEDHTAAGDSYADDEPPFESKLKKGVRGKPVEDMTDDELMGYIDWYRNASNVDDKDQALANITRAENELERRDTELEEKRKRVNEIKFVFNNREFNAELLEDNKEEGISIQINNKQTFNFTPAFANMYRDDKGGISEDNIKELAQSALSNLSEDFFEELAFDSEEESSEESETEDKLEDEPEPEKKIKPAPEDSVEECSGKDKVSAYVKQDQAKRKRKSDYNKAHTYPKKKKKTKESIIPNDEDNDETKIKKLTEKDTKMKKKIKEEYSERMAGNIQDQVKAIENFIETAENEELLQMFAEVAEAEYLENDFVEIMKSTLRAALNNMSDDAEGIYNLYQYSIEAKGSNDKEAEDKEVQDEETDEESEEDNQQDGVFNEMINHFNK